jgi:hypothetical protein
MKSGELDEMLKTFGRDGAVKAVSELAGKATKPREALRYLRWIADLEGWTKPRRVRQRRFDKSPKPSGREKI